MAMAGKMDKNGPCSSMSHPSETFIVPNIVPIFSGDFHMKNPPFIIR